MSPALMAIAPWSVGPSPSAHPVEPSVTVEVSGTHLGADSGGRVGVAVAPHPRLWLEVSGAAGSGWAMCPDCGVLGGQARARVLVVRAPAASVAVWGTAMTSGGPIDGLAGVAVEAGSDRVRVDTSWPLVSSWYLLTTLRIAPELGITSRWTPNHRTRLALVGVEPGVSVEHRATLGAGFTGTAGFRMGEEGLGGSLGVRWTPGSSGRTEGASNAGR